MNKMMDIVFSNLVYIRICFEELSERERGGGEQNPEKWCIIEYKRKETDKLKTECACLVDGSSSRSVT
jgi:hypothetical protein